VDSDGISNGIDPHDQAMEQLIAEESAPYRV
jgi:hypothetical protein